MVISINKIFALLIAGGLISCKEEKSQSYNSAAEITNKAETMNTIFLGTYTKKEGHVDGQADGIYTLYQDDNGNLKKGKTVAKVTNPSFVKVSKDSKYVFAVSELGPGDGDSGFVYSYKIFENDSLEEVSKLSSEGFAPAHISIDQSGNYVFVANYSGGVVMMYKLNDDGSLEKQQRIDLENPEESHAHSVTISPNNKKAYIADLGNDKIWIYNFDETEGKLIQAEQAFVNLPDGAGPRHFTMSKNGKFAYSINELDSSVSVSRSWKTADWNLSRRFLHSRKVFRKIIRVQTFICILQVNFYMLPTGGTTALFPFGLIHLQENLISWSILLHWEKLHGILPFLHKEIICTWQIRIQEIFQPLSLIPTDL